MTDAPEAPVIESPNSMSREDARAYQAAWRERRRLSVHPLDVERFEKHAADYDRMTQEILARRPDINAPRRTWHHTDHALRTVIANIHDITLRHLGKRHKFHAHPDDIPDEPVPGEETWPPVEILRKAHRKTHHDRLQGLASIAEIRTALAARGP